MGTDLEREGVSMLYGCMQFIQFIIKQDLFAYYFMIYSKGGSTAKSKCYKTRTHLLVRLVLGFSCSRTTCISTTYVETLM